MSKLKTGLVQIYTGKGKGKTTAAFGLAMRACGWGLKVYMIQFLKPSRRATGEAASAERLKPNLVLRRIDAPWCPTRPTTDAQRRSRMKRAVTEVLPEIREAVSSGEYDVVILDEIMVCLAEKLIDIADVIALIEQKRKDVELVLTGRNAPRKLIEMADLVTEMKEVKHPFYRGIKARKGIEF